MGAETAQIHVISLGVGARACLTEAAIEALGRASLVIGSERQLEMVASHPQGRRQRLPKMDALKAVIAGEPTGPVAVLASGDALFFGIGNWLKRHYASDRLVFYPNISSVQAACHAVGWDSHTLEVVSVHGRPLRTLVARLGNQRNYALLTDQQSRPAAIAEVLREQGLNESRLWVCERLGYPEQRIRAFSVAELLAGRDDFDPLHVTLLETRGGEPSLHEFPGLPDTAFVTDAGPGKGLLSKREVRLNILSLLAPKARDVLWDIGAGCGGVAVEWARWNPRGQVHAIEHHVQRVEALEGNRERFGLSVNLHIHRARAPQCLSELPDPNAVFVGGSDGDLAEILARSWQRLPQGGRLVASAVTEQSKQQLLSFTAQTRDGNEKWVQIAVSRGDSLAGQLLMRPQLPVTLMLLEKKGEAPHG